MHNFKELKVWQKAVKLAVAVYKKTAFFPSEEKFGLTSQIRRSAVSVPSNIAEGCGRNTEKGLSNFLGYSLGSQFELETQLIISKEIGLLNEENFETLTRELSETQKMTHALIVKFSETDNKLKK